MCGISSIIKSELGLTMKIDRRGILGAAGVLAGAVATNAKAAESKRVKFLHGIASGDPLQDRVILWTRVTPEANENNDIWVDWEIASDEGFKKLINHGKVKTNASYDYTVKVDATELKPYTDYYYRFKCGDIVSPIGKTRTLPIGNVEDYVIVAASCALFSCGFYNAYKEIANMQNLDVVLHLGDYIYEYGSNPDQLGMTIGEKIGRYPMPADEAVTLEDYRERYGCYRLDPDLQAAHARAPWICVWDDHETANDDWVGGAQDHQPNEGDWKVRAKASVLAYYEWIPIREPEKGKRPEAINRVFQIGNLASIIMMENRLVGRSRQIDIQNPSDVRWTVIDNSDKNNPIVIRDQNKTREILGLIAAGKEIPNNYEIKPDYDSLRASINAPERTVFGAEQEKWLEQEITKSVQSNKAWQIIGNQVVMANCLGIDIPNFMGKDRWDKTLSHMSPKLRPWVKQLENLPKDLPFGFDGWDAYPAARQRVDDIFEKTNSRTIVLSGDSHAFWLNELNNKSGKMVAAEIGTTSITSSSLGDMLGGLELGPEYSNKCKEVLFCNHLTRGFAVLTLNKDEAKVDLIGVSTVFSKEYKPFLLKSSVIKPAQNGGLERLKLI